MGLLNRVTSTIGRTGGRGAGGGGMATKATNFVRGFMSEGSGRNRRGRPAGRRRR